MNECRWIALQSNLAGKNNKNTLPMHASTCLPAYLQHMQLLLNISQSGGGGGVGGDGV